MCIKTWSDWLIQNDCKTKTCKCWIWKSYYQLKIIIGVLSQNMHSKQPQKRSGHLSPGAGGETENTQTHGARRERSRHAEKGQPSDIHNTGTRGTQHLTESDGRWQTGGERHERERGRGRTSRWDAEIEFKGAKEQKTARVRKTDYKRYRKQGEQSYCPDWL